MDRETTTAAETAASSTPGAESPTDDTTNSTTPRRRSSTWGKVQVTPKTIADAPEVTTPKREPKPETADTPAAPPKDEAPAPTKPKKPVNDRPTRTRQDTGPDEGVTTSDVEGADAETDGASGTPRKRRRRGGRGRGGGGGAETAESDVATDDGAEAAPSDSSDSSDSKARQSKQAQKPQADRPSGSREPKLSAGAPRDVVEKVASADDGESPEGDATAPKKRRRRGGRGRGGKKPATAAVDADTSETAESAETQRDDATPDTQAGSTGSGSRRRRGGKRPDQPAEKAPKKSKPKTLEEQVASGGPTRGIRSTRTRTGGRDGRRRREATLVPPRITDKLMAITEHGERDQIAVLEEDVLVQHYVTRAGATSMVGNVYLGRVQNVLPGMEAAFVDVGRGRNGVLYAGEVNYSPEDIEGPAPRIEQLLKPGQSVMVQVTKDPMGGKGARLTANLSLAGRYLVLAPNQNLQGISRRLGDDARKRLKSMLKRVKPAEHGVIVRTAAEGATEEALEADLRRLLKIWDDIQKAAKKGKAPTVLYEEPELTVRVVRDLFTDEEFKALVTDSQRVYDKITGYLNEVAPDLAQKVSLHTGSLPVFEEHRIVEQIHKALDKKVWLPSGGYLFIERTEAMTIVDVNTGKSVGKTNLEETVVNTNLEAAREVARQLRLRDIGGIIVVDFIDMLLEKNKKQVEDTMREALAIDKTRSQVFEIGPLGLMQVTRKRVSSGLVESFSETCPTCEGRGIILTYDDN